MRAVKQSTARNVMVFMTDSADHITGKTGLTLTITASKNGAAFASITPTVTERGSGWYNLALTASHLDTLGDFALHVTGTGADPSDLAFEVIAYDPADSAGLGLSRVDAAISTRALESGGNLATVLARVIGTIAAGTHSPQSGDAYARLGAPAGASIAADIATRLATAGYTAPDNASITAIKAKTDNLPASPAAVGSAMNLAANAVTAAAIATDAITDTKIAANAITAAKIATDAITATKIAANAITSAKIASGAITATQAPNLDAAVSTRLASASYTAPDNAGVAAIKAKTDNLPATPAATGDAMLLTAAAVDSILDEVIEGAMTLRQALRIVLAGVAGKASGAPTGPIRYRDLGDTKDRIIGTIDADGNRTAVTLDGV